MPTCISGRVHNACTRNRKTTKTDENQWVPNTPVLHGNSAVQAVFRDPLIIPDKDEVAGSNPAGPTNQTPCVARGFGYLPVNSITSRSRRVHSVHSSGMTHLVETIRGGLIEPFEEVPMGLESDLDREVTDPPLQRGAVCPTAIRRSVGFLRYPERVSKAP